MPTNPGKPDKGRDEQGGPHRRINRPMIVATATVLLASGGVGVAAAAASAPEPPASPTPTVSETPTGTPTLPTESPTGIPTDLPTGTPTAGPTDLPTPTPTAPSPAPSVPRPGAWALSGAPHGEIVLGTKDPCVFVTVLTQTGEATAVAEDSITVRSRDGFEKVYIVDDTTKVFAGGRDREVRQGDWLSVTSATGVETPTAAYVYDLSRPVRNLWRDNDRWYPPQWQWRHGRPSKWRTPKPCPTPPVPTPTSSPSVPPGTPTATPTGSPTDLPTDLPTPTGSPTGSPTDVPTTPAPTPTP
ncbi:hypothetical protein Ssi03_30780 [Sphaerisporangium siamense]|nr:hypothetical protein Ssi03_30780 [Sphaerisporangium siamense]